MTIERTNRYSNLRCLFVALAIGLTTVMSNRADAQVKPGLAQENLQNEKDQNTPLPGYQTQDSNVDRKTAEFIRKAATGGAMEIKLGRLALERGQNPAVKQCAQTLVNDHTRVNQQLLQLAQRKGVTLPADIHQHLTQNDIGITPPTVNKTDPNGSPSIADQGRFQRPPGQTEDPDRQQVRDLTKPGENRLTRDQPRPDQDRDGLGKQEDAEGQGIWNKLQNLSGTDFDRTFLEHLVKRHEKSIKAYEEATQALEDVEVKAFAASTLPTLRQHLQMALSLSTGTQTDRER